TLFFFSCSRAHPHLPSFPTRRSSDLPTEALVEGREEVQEVLEGVSKLPDDRREALIMRFALDMDNREIARALGRTDGATKVLIRSEEHTSELQSLAYLVCRLLLEKKK